MLRVHRISTNSFTIRTTMSTRSRSPKPFNWTEVTRLDRDDVVSSDVSLNERFRLAYYGDFVVSRRPGAFIIRGRPWGCKRTITEVVPRIPPREVRRVFEEFLTTHSVEDLVCDARLCWNTVLQLGCTLKQLLK